VAQGRRKLLRNTRQTTAAVHLRRRGDPSRCTLQLGASVGKLPYGVSIALGTLAFLVARQFTWV
jgi:prepilin peptidase CpaA